MMFALEKLFRVSEHCEHLDPCQVLNGDVRKSARLRKQLSFFSSNPCSDSKNYSLISSTLCRPRLEDN